MEKKTNKAKLEIFKSQKVIKYYILDGKEDK